MNKWTSFFPFVNIYESLQSIDITLIFTKFENMAVSLHMKFDM